MRSTYPIDKVEGNNRKADRNRHAKRWLIWTLLLLVLAYFIPLRWAVLLALFYARLADPALNLFRPARAETEIASEGNESIGAEVGLRGRVEEMGDTVRELQLSVDELRNPREAENPELDELRTEVSRLTESIEGSSGVLSAVSHDSRVLLEAVKRIDPSAIKTMEEIRSYDDRAQERSYAHAEGQRHWSDYEPSVKRLESDILKIKAFLSKEAT